jgi:hypothetical protein
MKIQYKNPDNLDEFIIEELDTSNLDLLNYCKELKKALELQTDEANTEIWLELNGEFILIGV